jgi:CheY-like chemotaxis protein
MADLVLVFDDETSEMQDWWDELREEGMTVLETTTTSELVAGYHAAQPDLIVLDRMPGRGNDYRWQAPSAGGDLQETLLLIHRDIRRSPHLRHAPIIVFTNFFDRSLAATLCAIDRRIMMLGKDTVPSEFVAKARAMIEHFRYPKGTAAADHPDRLSFHVRTPEGTLPVRFVPCAPKEHNVFQAGENWLLREIFSAYLDGDTPQDLLKCVLADETARVAGLLYLGGPDASWNEDVTFETAPDLRYGADNRPIQGVGAAMVARIVAEHLWRQNIPVDAFLDGLVEMPDDFAMHVFKSADPAFLTALGLRQDERDNLRWWCDGPAARYLLGRVLRPRF